MKISKKEIESLIELNPFERYKYFIKRVADSQVLYALKKEDWAISEVDGHMLFSVWSTKELAQLNISDEWSDYSIEEINLENFQTNIIPLIIQKGYLINVFSIKGKTGFVVNEEEFLRDLREDLEKYE